MCSFAFGASVAAHAQGVDWKKLNEEVMLLYKQGSYDRVVVVAENALQVADQAVGSNRPDVAASLSNLTGLYLTQGQYAQASAYKHSLTNLTRIQQCSKLIFSRT